MLSESDVLDWSIFEAFQDLRDLLHEIPTQLERSIERRHEQALAYYGSLDSDLAQEVQEIDRQLGQEFPRAITYSLVLLVYSQLEFYTKEVAGLLFKSRRLPERISSFNGDLVDRFRAFCAVYSLSGLSVPEQQELKAFTLIRNCIAHNAGVVVGTRNEPELRAFIEKTDGLSLNGSGEVLVVSFQYCASAIQYIGDALRRLVYANFDAPPVSLGTKEGAPNQPLERAAAAAVQRQ